jgi:STE24 endopeptidase
MTILFLSLYILLSAASFFLSWLNLRHLELHGEEVPRGFQDHLDADSLRKSSAYTVALNRVGLVESILDTFILLAFLFCGGLEVYDRMIAPLSDSFIIKGLLFFIPLYFAQSILDIPFSLYRHFSLENRFGFNTMTPDLWLADFLKSTALGATLVALLLTGAFAIIQLSPTSWWLWVWSFFAVVSLFLMYLSPCLIEPLFYKFEPIRAEGLEEDIRRTMNKAGLEVSRVLQVDASRRSRHSNAYFTGIGKVKRIVLFDTLLQLLDRTEVLAVLAHEAGHWKKRHLLKRLVMAEAEALVACYAAFRLLEWGNLHTLLGMGEVSFPAQLVILGFLFSLVTTIMTPVGNWLSRRHEREADGFATELTGMPEALATSLVKMSRDNLSNLHPHPLYAAIHYSHPPIAERVQSLLEKAKKKA